MIELEISRVRSVKESHPCTVQYSCLECAVKAFEIQQVGPGCEHWSPTKIYACEYHDDESRILEAAQIQIEGEQ